MVNKTGNFLELLNYCNTQISNENDYYIAKIIIENICKQGDISLEALSIKAHISQSSISRFIKKVGFDSYQSFRECIQFAKPDISLNRRLSHVTQFATLNDNGLADNVLNRAIENLQATKDKTDLSLLVEIIHCFLNANTVSFYGDDHALSLFYTLQIDLIANSIPSYLFKKEEFQKIHLSNVQKNDVIVFLNVYKHFITPLQKRLLLELHQKGAKLILICQDYDDDIKDCFDIVYQYGIENTVNDGFYSLYYINQLISELFYRYKFKS